MEFYIDWDQYDKTYVLSARSDGVDVDLFESDDRDELMAKITSGEAAQEWEEWLRDNDEGSDSE